MLDILTNSYLWVGVAGFAGRHFAPMAWDVVKALGLRLLTRL